MPCGDILGCHSGCTNQKSVGEDAELLGGKILGIFLLGDSRLVFSPPLCSPGFPGDTTRNPSIDEAKGASETDQSETRQVKTCVRGSVCGKKDILHLPFPGAASMSHATSCMVRESRKRGKGAEDTSGQISTVGGSVSLIRRCSRAHVLLERVLTSSPAHTATRSNVHLPWKTAPSPSKSTACDALRRT